MDWVRNALAALAVDLAKAEAAAIEKRKRYEQAKSEKVDADNQVQDLESARTYLRALLDPAEREVPY